MTSTASPTARVSNRPTTGLPTEGCQVELRAHGSSGAPRGGRGDGRRCLAKADVRSPLKASTELEQGRFMAVSYSPSEGYGRRPLPGNVDRPKPSEGEYGAGAGTVYGCFVRPALTTICVQSPSSADPVKVMPVLVTGLRDPTP